MATRKHVEMDETGRVIEVGMDEHVSHDSELAVQALPVERRPGRGHQTTVLSADHPDAVQALEPPAHGGLRRLSEEASAEAEARREAAKGSGDGHAETDESVDGSVSDKNPVEDDE
jgi:hypothetical protein